MTDAVTDIDKLREGADAALTAGTWTNGVRHRRAIREYVDALEARALVAAQRQDNAEAIARNQLGSATAARENRDAWERRALAAEAEAVRLRVMAEAWPALETWSKGQDCRCGCAEGNAGRNCPRAIGEHELADAYAAAAAKLKALETTTSGTP